MQIQVMPYDPDFGDGTAVTLIDLDADFSVARVRRYLRERLPLQAPQFAVFLNGEQLEEDIFYGRTHRFTATTRFGQITGTLVLTNMSWKAGDAGIGVVVKGMVITKETFGLEMTKRLGATRLRGKIAADFLPITSNRDALRKDSEEYHVFVDVCNKEIRKLLHVAKDLADRRADQHSSQVLKDALGKIGKALRKHDYLHPEHDIPMGEEIDDVADATDDTHHADDANANTGTGEGYEISNAQFVAPGDQLPEDIQERLKQNKQKGKGRGRPSVALGKKAIIRTLRLQNVAVAVRMEHLQDDEESILSGGIIYINLDHSLYRVHYQEEQLLIYHVARLITKELALQAMPGNASDAFRLQSELLTEAFGSGKGKNKK